MMMEACYGSVEPVLGDAVGWQKGHVDGETAVLERVEPVVGSYSPLWVVARDTGESGDGFVAVDGIVPLVSAAVVLVAHLGNHDLEELVGQTDEVPYVAAAGEGHVGDVLAWAP